MHGRPVELIDAPVVRRIHRQRAGIVGRLCLGQSACSAADRVKVIPEVHVMKLGV